MARTVPGSGAVIEPIFNDQFGVRAVKVLDGGQDYDSSDPPRLTVTGCGIPDIEALLYPIIDDDSGQIVHVRVLSSGAGYDPLRLSIVPEQDTPFVVSSFDINRIWQSNPNSQTTGTFAIVDGDLTDRLTITSDNHPKPVDYPNSRTPGGGSLVDQTFNSLFIYRGGKDVPRYGGDRPVELNKPTGIFANGSLLHTPDWGAIGSAPAGFSIDTVRYDYLLNTNQYDGVTNNNQYYYHTNKLIDQFAQENSVFDNGNLQQFTWRVKTETDNILIDVSNIDETINPVEEGRLVELIGNEFARGVISKIIRDNNNNILRMYLKSVEGEFEAGDRILGSTGFSMTIANSPIEFPNGLFYIEFGPEAHEFGNFTPGVYYLAPRNIRVQRNYQIIWDQSDSSNQPSTMHPQGHPMRFSTTPDGPLNQTPGTIYYDSTGASAAPSADYENEFRPTFIMNADEVNRIYYYCGYHQHMSGYIGDEGYMILDPTVDDEELPNNYYTKNYYKGRQELTANDIAQGAYQMTISNVTHITTSGDGTGASGGFDIGDHFLFNGGSYRQLRFTLDLTSQNTLEVKIIRGDDFNGGEEVDRNEDLLIEFVGSVYGPRIIGYYTSPNTVHSVTVNIPPDARKPGQQIKVYQERLSGSVYDHWGFKSVTTGVGADDFSRNLDGHSKILGMSYDGYPIYGPFGYDAAGDVVRQTSSYRTKTGNEVDGNRPRITTTGTVNYNVTVSNGKFLIDGVEPPFLQLDRGKKYVFNQDTLTSPVLFALQEDGWHIGDPPQIGNTQYLYQLGVQYFIDNVETTYLGYITNFAGATNKRLEFTPRVNSPRLLYVISYGFIGYGFRCVQDGYLAGDFIEDYIYEEGLGTLDRFNGKFAVTPEYPGGTYAYFMSTDTNDDPVYPYVIGPEFYGVPYHPVAPGQQQVIPPMTDDFPRGAAGEVVLNPDGSVGYVKMVRSGDGYFGPASAKILGGEGTGATGSSIVQTVTGLTLLNQGREFATPPTLIFEGGGGGQGARGRAQINTAGKVTGINIVDNGEYYQEPPYILITGGGGIGAKAVAEIDQGEISAITITDPGTGYTNPPNIIFTKLTNLKRFVKNRQSYNSTPNYLTGLLKDVSASDTEIYVDNTDAYPGSGSLILNNEILSYTSKSRERFQNLTRGKNFKYDQRVIIDATQVDGDGNSLYQFNVGDRVLRRVENQNNKIAKVYDWDPATRALLVTFEVDELAFIDGGIPSTEDAVVQFDAGVAASAAAGYDPHVILEVVGTNIVTLTDPIGILPDRDFEDDDELDGAGDGIPDLVNTGTDFENQISLDGGIYNSLYGIEETVGGQNTTLFAIGDQVKDASLPFKYATILEAGGLNEGVPHSASMTIYLDLADGNEANYFPEETVTGEVSQVRATVTSWNPSSGALIVRDVVPYDTGNLNVGVNGVLNKFSDTGTIKDFIVQNPGNDYSATPSIAIETAGDVQATATAVMTTAGDQIASVTVNNGGYGYVQSVDQAYAIHPTVTVNNDAGDSTGNGAVIQAILGGEKLSGTNGAQYRIKRVEFDVQIRSE